MTYNQLIEQSIVNMSYGHPKELKGATAPTILSAIKELMEEGIEKRLNILIEVVGNSITKYPTLTIDQVIEWNRGYESETCVALRANPHWMTKAWELRAKWNKGTKK